MVKLVESYISSPLSPEDGSKAVSSSPIPQSSSRGLVENSKSMFEKLSSEMRVWKLGASVAEEGQGSRCRSLVLGNKVGGPNRGDVDDEDGWAGIGNSKDGVPNERNRALSEHKAVCEVVESLNMISSEEGKNSLGGADFAGFLLARAVVFGSRT